MKQKKLKMEPLLKTDEAAAYLGCTPDKLRSLARNREIDHYDLHKHTNINRAMYRFSKDKLKEYKEGKK